MDWKKYFIAAAIEQVWKFISQYLTVERIDAVHDQAIQTVRGLVETTLKDWAPELFLRIDNVLSEAQQGDETARVILAKLEQVLLTQSAYPISIPETYCSAGPLDSTAVDDDLSELFAACCDEEDC